jgi:4-amino-4-deoxy-L-arabinose transferase-like glycosyltransferase
MGYCTVALSIVRAHLIFASPAVTLRDEMKTLDWGTPRLRRWLTIGTCGGLLILFAVLSRSAGRSKSATYDEPLHAVAGWVRRTTGDFRINQEDPALFGYWASLRHGSKALTLNTDLRWWDEMLTDFNNKQWWFVWWTLYKTPGVNPDEFIQQSRFMFIIVGVALGALIAWWSWQLAGMWAALLATALFALDPNFLAHSALVKNDVALSFTFLAMALALWRFGRRGTILSLIALGLSCAAAVNVKFSGVLCAPIVVIALLVRALLPQDWSVIGMNLTRIWQRLVAVPAACLIVGLIAYLGIWACYGFRFVKTTAPNAPDDIPRLLQLTRAKKTQASFDVVPSQEQFDERYKNTKAGRLPDLIEWTERKHLLPQAWLHGFLYTYATTQLRSTFLMGTIRHRGVWYYFPCAMAFKTPTATLAAIPLALIGVTISLFSRRGLAGFGRASANDAVSASASKRREAADFDELSRVAAKRYVDWWTLTCLSLPVLVYFTSAMTTNLNLGLRHILPVYPFLFIALGLAIARIARWEMIVGSNLALLIVLVLAIESFRAYPNYLAFFNAPSGGASGGFKLLGDSNLDWGQDLKLLASWQEQHSDKPLYLAYFGVADPSAYGVKAMHLPMVAGGWPFAEFNPSTIGLPAADVPCYLAISATNLQGIYVDQPFFHELLKREPLTVLGGSIYVYAFPWR